MMKDFFYYLIGKLIDTIQNIHNHYLLNEYRKVSGCKINFIKQGEGGVYIGHPEFFFIDITSHVKSSTYIECQGGVTIGRYFHVGRGLTIFSGNHNYESDDFIPYGKASILRPVHIKDFVWIGSNVLILPGVTIGEGAVIGAGSVVVNDIPDFAIAVGNPAKVVKYRNVVTFKKLKEQGRFF